MTFLEELKLKKWSTKEMSWDAIFNFFCCCKRLRTYCYFLQCYFLFYDVTYFKFVYTKGFAPLMSSRGLESCIQEIDPRSLVWLSTWWSRYLPCKLAALISLVRFFFTFSMLTSSNVKMLWMPLWRTHLWRQGVAFNCIVFKTLDLFDLIFPPFLYNFVAIAHSCFAWSFSTTESLSQGFLKPLKQVY